MTTNGRKMNYRYYSLRWTGLYLAREDHQHQQTSGLCLLSAPSLILQRKKSKKLQAYERKAREKIASFFYQETKSNCATLL